MSFHAGIAVPSTAVVPLSLISFVMRMPVRRLCLGPFGLCGLTTGGSVFTASVRRLVSVSSFCQTPRGVCAAFRVVGAARAVCFGALRGALLLAGGFSCRIALLNISCVTRTFHRRFRCWWVLPCFVAVIRCARCCGVPLVCRGVIVVRRNFSFNGRPSCIAAIISVRAVGPGSGLGNWEAKLDQGRSARCR